MARVSVIIPSYNHEKFVRETIQSILDQTFQDFEIIITDDGSTDKTVSVIRSFTDPRIKLFCFEKNQGACVAANKCLIEAKGEFIAMLSSDDVFVPDKLEKQVSFLDQNPIIGAVFSYAQIIDEEGNDLTDDNHFYKRIFIQPNRTGFEWLNYFFFKLNCLCHPSALIRKQCYNEVGQYNEVFAQLPDFDFWIRLCMKYEIHILPENCLKFRVLKHEANASGEKPAKNIRQTLEIAQILKNFLNPYVLNNFSKIFPNTLDSKDVIDPELAQFFIATLALQVNNPGYKYFGIETLCQTLRRKDIAYKIKKQYNFGYTDLIKITGEEDVFRIAIESKYQQHFWQTQADLQKVKLQLEQVQADNILGKPPNKLTLESKTSKSIEYPSINPVSESICRPFWSVMIPTYNGAKYLKKTLASVLKQDIGSSMMQIEVIDDCSTEDDIEAIVNEVGQGRISFYQQSKNLGLIGSWNACIQRARGHWVHILHQDDLVMPEFYSKFQTALENNSCIGAAFCRHIFINEEGSQKAVSSVERQTPGILENWLERIAVEQLIQCPSIVVRRNVYEKLGGFCPEAGYAADWEMWKRIAVNYQFWYEPETLAYYRSHSLSATSRYTISGANIADTRRAIEISETYLPKNIVEEVSVKSREHYALYAFSIANQMLNIGHIDVAFTQIKEGLQCSKSSTIMGSLAALLVNSEPLLRLVASLFVSTENIQDLTYSVVGNHPDVSIDFDLRDINLIIFPNWQQPEEVLYKDLTNIIKAIVNYTENNRITLLIDNSGISPEDANLILSDIIFNLLQEEDLDVTEEPAIFIIGDLSAKQWDKLLPRINAKLFLTLENEQAIVQAKAENIPGCTIESISSIQTDTVNLSTTSLIPQANKRINVVSSVGSKPRIDVVLQATGLHGWSCSRGWVNVLQREGLLNRVFTPVADWGANEPKYDDGLFDYLRNPQADVMLLLGFDWHSQPLHRSLKWQEQWSKTFINKIAVLQECYSSDLVQNTEQWQQSLSIAIASTVSCVDALVCHHEPDVSFLQQQLDISLPILFLPFAIDPEYFKIKTPFDARLNRAIFRGNIAPFFTDDTYQERRNLLESLSQCPNVDLFQLQFNNFANPNYEVQRYIDELNTYRLLLNLPSMSLTLTARPFEIMASGGVLLQNNIIGEQSNNLFTNWKNIVYYPHENPQELINIIKYLVENPDIAGKIAEQGHQLCYDHHTISHRIEALLNWLANNFESKRGQGCYNTIST